MNYKQYRVGPGHYVIGDFTIYGCYPRWQVRDRDDDLLEDFALLREAIEYAWTLTKAEGMKQLRATLSNPKIVELVNS